jgi:hypothetical protein
VCEVEVFTLRGASPALMLVIAIDTHIHKSKSPVVFVTDGRWKMVKACVSSSGKFEV